MSIFSRLKSLVSAMFNQGLSKLETPEVLAEQAQGELESNVKKIKEALTSSLANEKMIEQQLKKQQEMVEQWQQRAGMAVQQNNDELARECLKKREEATQQVAQLEMQLKEQKVATTSLKQRFQDVEQQMREFQTKKSNLISRHKASEAVSSANNLLGDGSGSGGMDKWEEKIRMKEARSEANRELAQDSKLKDQIAQLEVNSDVDDQLAMLKQQMAASAAPKLIVETPKLLLEDKSQDSNP